MKTLTCITALLTLIFLQACESENTTDKTLEIKVHTTDTAAEKMSLQKLLREMYAWHETKSSQDDLVPLPANTDGSYLGLDLQKHDIRMRELQSSGFFSDRFLTSYDLLARNIDRDLRSGAMQWEEGDMPPFGNGANPWCNCQDNPEHYWDSLTIHDLHIHGDRAVFNWSWGEDSKYKTEAVSEKGAWKIAYLEGFDAKHMMPAE